MKVFHARRTLIWGVSSLVLGGVLFGSFKLGGGAVGKAEREAQQRAEDYANTVLYKALTPGLVLAPIAGREYGEILIQVQAGILSDDDVVRVRVWNAAGQLVFSSDQRDRLGQEAGFGGVLRRVLDGTTVSESTGPRVAPQPGLAGSSEQLLRSYVPLRLGDQTSASAAAEIDQRYSAILASARSVWLPVQIAVGVALLAALAMLVMSIRGSGVVSGAAAAADPRAAERVRALEKQMKELEKRAKDADDRAKEAFGRADQMTKAKSALEQQLANSERNLRDTLTARRTGEEDAAAMSSRVPELERELAELRDRAVAVESVVPGVSAEELAAAQTRAREAESERDRLAREIERLNIAMSESGAANARTVELEARLAELQKTGSDSDARVAAAQARTSEAEQRLAEAEARSADAERRLAEIEQRSKSHVDQAQTDLDRISVRLGETQAALAESTDKLTRMQTELEQVQQEKADAVIELQRAGLATGERDEEVQRLRSAIGERDEQLQELERTVLERNAELEQLRSGLGERSGEAEQARAEAAAMAAELEQLRTEAAAKAAELEQLRTEAIAKNAELDALRLEANARNAELEQHRAEAAARASEIDTLRARLAELEAANAAAEARTTELGQQHALITSKDEELAQLRVAVADRDTEIVRIRGQLEEATAEAAAATQGHTGSTDDARRRLAELEELRRTDVAGVQQANEQLANAQLELRQARERIEQLEERARQIPAATVDGSIAAGPNGSTGEAEHGLFGEHAADSPVFEPPDEATVGSRLSAFRRRRHSPRIDEPSSPPEEQWQPAAVAAEHEPEPAMPEISAEGLSLRERLTRAAAARHRVTTPTERDERDVR